ncbi:hypothetical protein [Sorangium sp. So ce1000]|uniref:hypothetical protein n=1 Tax=Sorangium sp. So ce1000 TaxID=3133325 RepID=UPI003F5DDA34
MMQEQVSIHAASHKPNGQSNGSGSARSAEQHTEPAAAAPPSTPQPASTGPGSPPPPAPSSKAAPRHDRPWLRVLGIERNVDGEMSGDATLAELLTKSFCGEVSSDPIDGILRSLGDDLSMVRNALQSDEVCTNDPDVQMYIYRLEQRANVAHQLWRRLVVETNYGASAPAAAPAAASAPAPTPTPAAQATEPFTLFKAGAKLGRAAVDLEAFADLAERCAASAVPRREAYDAGVKVQLSLGRARELAELDSERVTDGLAKSRFDDLLRGLSSAIETVDDAVEQLGKTRFRRRERSAKVHAAIERAQGQLRFAQRSANEVIDLLRYYVLPKSFGMDKDWPRIHAEACRIAPDVPRHLIDGLADTAGPPPMRVTPQLVADFARAIAAAQERAAQKKSGGAP